MRVGLCLPAREAVSRSGSGAIPEPFRSAILERLRARPDLTLYEDVHFNDCYVHDGRVFRGELCVSELDLYLWYAHTSRQPASYDLQILKTLARSLPVVRDPGAHEQALDKYTAHLALRRAGAAVAEFVLVDRDNLACVRDLVESWGAAVLKPRRGAFGLGVGFIDSFAMFRDVVEYVRTLVGHDPDGGYLLERYYPNDPDEWTSVTMVGGQVMYGYRKLPHTFVQDRHGRAKVYDATRRGGEVEGCTLTPAQIELAHRAQRTLALEVVGFDMIVHEGRPLVVDENTAPGFYPELFAQAGRDPVEEFCGLFDGLLTQRKS